MDLYVTMLERTAFMICIAIIIMTTKNTPQYLALKTKDKNNLRLIFFFSGLSILGTYLGVPIRHELDFNSFWLNHDTAIKAVVNTRSMGIVLAGLLGGPKIGFIVGLIAGAHRYYIGGFLALACLLSNMLQGYLAGRLKIWFEQSAVNRVMIIRACIISISLECLHMLFILLLSKPYESALHLLSLIFAPQVLVNGIGVGCFFLLFFQVRKIQQQRIQDYTKQGLTMASIILPQWKKNFSEAIRNVSNILLVELHADGIEFISQGKREVFIGQKASYIVQIPFGKGKKDEGVFQLYYENKQSQEIGQAIANEGLIQLLEYQYAFVEKEEKERLLMNAELKALQAQMNPHFLFNALNTVRAMIRTKPDEAREMIAELGKFLRQSVQKHDDFITIKSELYYVESYYKLMKARLGEQIIVERHIPDDLLDCHIPPLSIQPLVENAIKHGFRDRNGCGKITITIKEKEERVFIVVHDNGSWKEKKEMGEENLGFALEHLKKRLQLHFGKDNILRISYDKSGTTVSFWIRRKIA